MLTTGLAPLTPLRQAAVKCLTEQLAHELRQKGANCSAHLFVPGASRCFKRSLLQLLIIPLLPCRLDAHRVRSTLNRHLTVVWLTFCYARLVE